MALGDFYTIYLI